MNRHIKNMLVNHKIDRNNMTEQQKRVLVNDYVDSLDENSMNRTSTATEANRILTDNEEKCLVSLVVVLSAAGHSVSRKDCMDMISSYIGKEEDPRRHRKVTQDMFESLKSRHKDLKVVSSNSIDSARARKATRETRERVFVKLEAYIQNLHRQDKIPWETFREVPWDRIYNMDEVGANTTSHRAKMIATKKMLARMFCVTPEGDGKMNLHISAAVTTRADGEWAVDCWLGGPSTMRAN